MIFDGNKPSFTCVRIVDKNESNFYFLKIKKNKIKIL